ncbi:MAG: hypothetical protein JXA57_20635 [Armatimonadetes bacterium]|nr:hypothetical protein [Armatimonadota bacterium]
MSDRSPRIRRPWRLVVWGLVVAVVLAIANWVAAHAIAAGNQRKIDRLHAALAAQSLEELAGLDRFGVHEIPGNGWYLVLGALSCISEASGDALGDGDVPPMSAEQKAVMEQELDRAHGALELARRAPRIVAPLPDWFSRVGHPMAAFGASSCFVRATIHSARDRLEAGEEARAAERLLDGWMIARQFFWQADVRSFLVAQTELQALLQCLGPSVQAFAPAQLERLQECLQDVNLENRARIALGAEVLFMLSLWQDGMSRELQRWAGFSSFLRWVYPRALSEIDRSAYLNLALAQVVDATAAGPGSVTAAAPFYAPVAARLAPALAGPSLARAQEKCQRMLAIACEAIRLELARRRGGEWPEPSALLGGIAIQVSETDESITLAEPPRDDGRAYRIVLRK